MRNQKIKNDYVSANDRVKTSKNFFKLSEKYKSEGKRYDRAAELKFKEAARLKAVAKRIRQDEPCDVFEILSASFKALISNLSIRAQ